MALSSVESRFLFTSTAQPDSSILGFTWLHHTNILRERQCGDVYLPIIILKGKCSRRYALLSSFAPCSTFIAIFYTFFKYDVQVFEESMTDGGGSNFCPFHNMCGGCV